MFQLFRPISESESDMDENDPIERRRRQRESNRRWWLSVGVLLGGLMVVGLLVVVVVLARGKGTGPGVAGGAGVPSETSEGEKWTHKELAEYLGKRGVPVDYYGTNAIGGRPVSSFVAKGDGGTWSEKSPRSVSVVLCRDGKDARELASADMGSFAWGRFYFQGKSNDLFAKTKAALGK